MASAIISAFPRPPTHILPSSLGFFTLPQLWCPPLALFPISADGEFLPTPLSILSTHHFRLVYSHTSALWSSSTRHMRLDGLASNHLSYISMLSSTLTYSSSHTKS